MCLKGETTFAKHCSSCIYNGVVNMSQDSTLFQPGRNVVSIGRQSVQNSKSLGEKKPFDVESSHTSKATIYR